MKKILSLLLTVMLMVSMVSTVSAATIADKTTYMPNPFDLPLALLVEAQVGDAGYSAATQLQIETDLGKVVDYKTTLDMAPIRALFSEGFMTAVLPNDAEIQEEFNNGKVSSEIKVVIEYPSTAVFSKADALSKGGLNTDSFIEKSRSFNDKTLTIIYENAAELKVSALNDDADGFLKDVVFTLEDTVTYKEAGAHKVKVTLSGSTTVKFASATQIINYTGEASHIVNATRVNMVNHILAVVPAVPPTCTEMGWTEGIICSTCNSYDCGADGTVEPAQTVPVLDHVTAFVPAISGTCKETGVRAHYTCSLCKADFRDEYATDSVSKAELVSPAPGHSAVSDGSANTSPTCTEQGYEPGQKCSVCNIMIKPATIIPMTAHTAVTIPAVAATCETNGLTAGKECSVCHKVITAQKVIEAIGHTYGEWNITAAPTENSTGTKVRVCSKCGATDTVVIPKLVHTHAIDANADVKKLATCSDAGYIKHFCACGEPMGEDVIPALGHSLVHVDEVAATCINKGVAEHYNCSTCKKNFRDENGKNELKSIETPKDKANHATLLTLAGYSATCVQRGLTEGKICTACNTIVEKQKPTALVAHALVDIAEKAATCVSEGVKAHKHCSVCDGDFDAAGNAVKAKALVIPATGHSYGQPVRTDELVDDGQYFKATKTCVLCNDAIIQTKVPVSGNCEHKITVGAHVTDTVVLEIVTAPSCTADGVGKKVCHICAETVENNIVIPKVEHEYEYVAQVNSTCKEQGTVAHYICSECDKIFDLSKNEIDEPAKLDLLSHDFRKQGSHQVCHNCNEKVQLTKKDKDGNVNAALGVVLEKAEHIKQTVEDVISEQIIKQVAEVIDVITQFEVAEREETSKGIEERIQEKKAAESTDVNKLVFDININKAIFYQDVTEPVVIPFNETEDLVEIVVDIPENLRNAKSLLVFRNHEGTDEILRESNDRTKERFERNDNKVKLYVKKFSEYAIVGYSDTVVEEETPTNRPSGLGGGSGVTTVTVKFNANGGSLVKAITVQAGKKITLPEAPTRAGYVFAGWYLDPAFKEMFDVDSVIETNMILYAKWDKEGEAKAPVVPKEFENTDEHYAFIIGYTDGTIRPNNNISREEVATIFYRLLTPEYREEILATENNFTDVEADRWSNKFISTIANGGYIVGYENMFKPADYITRAEFVTIASRFIAQPSANEVSFNDIDSHWAKDYIIAATNEGWIYGDENGSFNPDKFITRAEAIAIFNRILGHSADKDITVEGVTNFSDINASDWFYNDILEATNSHKNASETVGAEDWSELLLNRDWSKF